MNGQNVEKNVENEYIEADVRKPSSSFELKHSSRGVSVRVKIYTCDEVEQLEKAMNEAVDRFELLRKKYVKTEKK